MPRQRERIRDRDYKKEKQKEAKGSRCEVRGSTRVEQEGEVWVQLFPARSRRTNGPSRTTCLPPALGSAPEQVDKTGRRGRSRQTGPGGSGLPQGPTAPGPHVSCLCDKHHGTESRSLGWGTVCVSPGAGQAPRADAGSQLTPQPARPGHLSPRVCWERPGRAWRTRL